MQSPTITDKQPAPLDECTDLCVDQPGSAFTLDESTEPKPIVFEFDLTGGARFLTQVVANMLMGKNVSLYIGLPNTTGWFITTHFLAGLREVETRAEAEMYKADYFTTHILCNPDTHNAHTEQALFDGAWKLILENHLWAYPMHIVS